MSTDYLGRNVIDKNTLDFSDIDIHNDHMNEIQKSVRAKIQLNDVNVFKTELEKVTDYLDEHDISYERTGKNSIEINADLSNTERGSYCYGTVTMEGKRLSVTDDLADGKHDKGLTAKEVISRISGSARGRTETMTIPQPRDPRDPGDGGGGSGGAGAANVKGIKKQLQINEREQSKPIPRENPGQRLYDKSFSR